MDTTTEAAPWILVVARKEALAREEAAMELLRDRGLEVRGDDLFGRLDVVARAPCAPRAVLVEALGGAPEASAAIARIRAAPRLLDAPLVLAVPIEAVEAAARIEGVDDFVVFPYVPTELWVRLARARRRVEGGAAALVRVGPLALDLDAHEVTAFGLRVVVTRQELSLLACLATNVGRVFSREELLARAWGAKYGNSRTVDMHIGRLRAKLGRAGDAIVTVRGVGYKLRAPEPPPASGLRVAS